MCAATSCHNISSQYDLVEDRILSTLRDWTENAKIEWGNLEQSKSGLQQREQRKALKRLEDELCAVEKQSNSLYDLLEQGVYTTEKFLERSKHLENRAGELHNEIERLHTSLDSTDATEGMIKSVIPRVERAIELYNTAQTAEEKNLLLSGVIEKVIYTKSESGGRWDAEKAKSFMLQLYPKL